MATLRAVLPPTRYPLSGKSILEPVIRPTNSLPTWQRTPRQLSRRPLARHFGTCHKRKSGVVPQSRQQDLSAAQPPVEQKSQPDEQEAEQINSETKDPDKPWYLQLSDAAAVDEPNPFTHRQKLPDLPPNPPPLIEPLLSHLSIQIGLDYLTIIDLRNVDPPPAFGANLFMIFGTARSEKHLNVSADRLCRWLRTEHKLTPCADGLLGRNELKLKMKRKARRSKMMQAVGAGNSGVPDDGTRTGWVCVNVGAIGSESIASGGQEEDLSEQQKGFVGFGKTSDDAKVVIQMMTEEKRVELDLETLWNGVRKGSIKRREAAEGEETETHRPLLLTQDPDVRRSHFMTGVERREQVRAFHSSARRPLADGSVSGSPHPTDSTDDLPPSMFRSHHTTGKELPTPPLSESASQENKLCKALVGELITMPTERAKAALGTGSDDRTSTSFLRDFFDSMSLFPTSSEYLNHLRLQAYALHLQHPGYSKQSLHDLLLDMELSCPFLPLEAFTIALDAILSTPHTLPLPLTADSPRLSPSPFPQKPFHQKIIRQPTRPQDQHTHPLKHDTSYPDNLPPETGHVAVLHTITLATSILERLPAHNHAALPPDFFIKLNECIAYPRFLQQQKIKLHPAACETLLHQLLRIVTLTYSTPSPTHPATVISSHVPAPLITSLLTTHAQTRNWQGFWRIWRAMALRMQQRTAQMYAILFREVGRQGDARVVRRVLAEWAPEMSREREVVEMDEDVAEGVVGCLKVLGKESGELWERCMGVLGRQRAGGQGLEEDVEREEELVAEHEALAQRQREDNL